MKNAPAPCFFIFLAITIFGIQGFAEEPGSKANPLNYSLIPIFEPHAVFNLTALDSRLVDYGFTPLDSPLLMAWGIQGTFYEPGGLLFGAKVTYGNQSSQPPGYTASTYTAFTKMGFFAGYSWGSNLGASIEGGFSALSHSLSSALSGGALVYLGPYIQPTVTFHLHKFRWLGAISVGYYVHFCPGVAHMNPLWEEMFLRPVDHGLVVSIGSGFANKGE